MPQLYTIRSSITNGKWNVSVDIKIVSGFLRFLMKNNNIMSDIWRCSSWEEVSDELVWFYSQMSNHLKYILVPVIEVVLVSLIR